MNLEGEDQSVLPPKASRIHLLRKTLIHSIVKNLTAGQLPGFSFKLYRSMFILGKKLKMTRIFKNGESIPVTLIEAGPCKVLQIKNKEKDKYDSVQIGFQEILKKNKIKKSSKGKNFKYIKEFSLDKGKEYKIEETIDLSFLKEEDFIKVSGISKGKGFQGGVKRWGFSGANATHGTKHNERKIGSIGSAFPQRVIKGRKMPGRMGSDRTTVKNLKVIEVDVKKNIIAVKGAIPGRPGTLLEIRAYQKKNQIDSPEI
jgi:large subunit ribosomal protein L3